MKIKYILPIAIFFVLQLNAQVGIGTTSPDASAILDVDVTSLPATEKKGFLPPRMNTAQRDAINLPDGPAPGLVIFNTDLKCLEFFNNTEWINMCFGGKVLTLDCLGATRSGSLIENTMASSVSFSVPYTGGNGQNYLEEIVNSSGVGGLTATRATGTLNNGDGTLLYTITGTPTSSGVAQFTISLGNMSCTVEFPVASELPLTINLGNVEDYFVLSVFDTNYEPYTVPSGTALLPGMDVNLDNPDGTTETVTVDYQGIIPAAGVSIEIPFEVPSGSVTLPAFSQTLTVPSTYYESGSATQLTFGWSEQPGLTGTGTFTATLRAEGSDFLARKLDMNSGSGADYLGFLLAEFVYPSDNFGGTENLSIRDVPGIPDRYINVTDNAGNLTHNFVYLPKPGEDGKVWLNNNLGATYNKLGDPDFNPIQQALDIRDHKAYGSLYQWGRKSDGHELINWSDSFNGTPEYSGTTIGPLAEPLTTEFFIEVSAADWRNPSDGSLWNTALAVNNPCPVGFKVPTATDFEDLFIVAGIEGLNSAFNSTLNFTGVGYRDDTGILQNSGQLGFYSTATVGTTDPNRSFVRIFRPVVLFPPETTENQEQDRVRAYSVRCVKD